MLILSKYIVGLRPVAATLWHLMTAMIEAFKPHRVWELGNICHDPSHFAIPNRFYPLPTLLSPLPHSSPLPQPPTPSAPVKVTSHLPPSLPPPTPQGFETTSHAITWTLGLLACHPTTQDKVAQELATLGLCAASSSPPSAPSSATLQPSSGSSPRPSPLQPPREFEWGDLGRLPYLNTVIKEALRLYPPVSDGL